MTIEDILEAYWSKYKHYGVDPPSAHMARLDASVTLNLVEMEELHNLLTSDDNKPLDANYFLSEECVVPFQRGRILKKMGKVYKLAKACRYGK